MPRPRKKSVSCWPNAELISSAAPVPVRYGGEVRRRRRRWCLTGLSLPENKKSRATPIVGFTPAQQNTSPPPATIDDLGFVFLSQEPTCRTSPNRAVFDLAGVARIAVDDVDEPAAKRGQWKILRLL